ncbi:transposase [Leptospira bouyouniensis]|uniref:transposase n=1 Tax=Leptospira bouyouniensis TaxID=2484911 RepID=UPI001FEDAEE4|nr:transposase [Leptospira bouyouniensis]
MEAETFKDYKYKSASGIHTEKFQKLTYKILYDLYPKYCPKCNVILSKGVKNRPDLVRCGNKNCHHQVSRLSYTPLHHFKLPIWMFGYILEESILQFPKVITSVEISKRLSISYKSARLLKQRLQVFSSHQVEVLRKLYYNDLKDTFKDVTLPKVEDGKDVKKHLGKKLYRKIPHTDTAVLYSASQRSNQHRKRFRHGGLTASIYQSDSVGGRQVGILVSTIATQNGCVFFDSVPDQKANTLGTLLRKTVPYESPLFSDEGYPWLWGIYKKHRTVNHQAHSKDKRYKFAKNRWSKFSIHNQVAEGNQRLLKSAFSAYCYIKPTYSQLYLNELSFYKSIKAVGMDRLVTAQREGVVPNVSRIYPLNNSYLKDQISKYCYHPLTLEERNRQKTASVLNQGNPILESIYQNRKMLNLHIEMKRNDHFWKNPEIKYYIKLKEKYYGSIAKNLWNALSETKSKKWINFNKTVLSAKLPKRTSLRIVRRWAELKIVSLEDYQNYNTERQGYEYLIKLNVENLPKLLYHQTRLEFEGGQNKIRKYIKTKKRRKHYGRKE